MNSTVAIESPVNNTVEKPYIKICHKGKDNKSVVGSSTKSVVTCHKCGKRALKIEILNPIEMVQMGNCPRNHQESFQNGSPGSL